VLTPVLFFFSSESLSLSNQWKTKMMTLLFIDLFRLFSLRYEHHRCEKKFGILVSLRCTSCPDTRCNN